MLGRSGLGEEGTRVEGGEESRQMEGGQRGKGKVGIKREKREKKKNKYK